MYQLAIADQAMPAWHTIADQLPDPVVYEPLSVTTQDQVQVWSVLITDRSAMWLKLTHPEWQPHAL
jgi:hypothetical protein